MGLAPMHPPLLFHAPPPREHLPRRSWKACVAATLFFLAASAIAGCFAILPSDWRWIGGIGLVAQGAVIGGFVVIGLELRYLIELQRLATGDLRPTVTPPDTPNSVTIPLENSTDWMKRYWRAWDAGRGNPGPEEHREVCQSSANSLTAFLMVPNVTTVSAMVALATITSIVGTLHQKSTWGAQGEQLFRLATLTWYECTLLLAASLGVCGFARSIVNRWTTAVMALAPLPMPVEPPRPIAPVPVKEPPHNEHWPDVSVAGSRDPVPIAPSIVACPQTASEALHDDRAPNASLETLPQSQPAETNSVDDAWAFLGMKAANPPAVPPGEPAP